MSSADSESTTPIELRPFHEQAPFLDAEKTYYGYVSGVGAGKTYAGVLRTALNMVEWNPGEMGAIVAPTTTMAKDVIVPLFRETGLLEHWTYKSIHADEPGIHAPNGSRALLLSADNRRTVERLAGLNLAWFWVDEASRVPERAYEILTQRLRVGEYRNGYLTTTPRGQDYVYEAFVGDVEGERSQYGAGEVFEADDRLAILHVPTGANPHTPVEYKEQMEQKEGQVYEREILGLFTDFEGLIYPWFDEDNLVSLEDVRDNYNDVLFGVDWGHNNPAVALCILRNGEDYIVVDEWYERQCTVQDHADAVLSMVSEWGEGAVYCDPSEPASIEAFKRRGLAARAGDNSVQPGIQHIQELQDRLYVGEWCQNLRNEFHQYRYREGSEKPVKEQDHGLDGLRYALFTYGQGPSGVHVMGSEKTL